MKKLKKPLGFSDLEQFLNKMCENFVQHTAPCPTRLRAPDDGITGTLVDISEQLKRPGAGSRDEGLMAAGLFPNHPRGENDQGVETLEQLSGVSCESKSTNLPYQNTHYLA